MEKPNYHDEQDRQQVETRLRALSIAHDPQAPAKAVVERAAEYVAFVEKSA
jgi:hypothetical protein